MSQSPPTQSWKPGADELENSNVARLMRKLGVASYGELHAWSVADRSGYWRTVVDELDIRFRRRPDSILDLTDGVESPRWLPGAELNIAESCFLADPDATAVVSQGEDGPRQTMSYAELDELSGRVAAGVTRTGLAEGDAVAIDMPMTVQAVAIYLGLVKAGCLVVSIADSFAPEEIATRLRIADAKAIFTVQAVQRGAKILPLFEKVVAAGAPMAIVIPLPGEDGPALRDGDLRWDDFLPVETVAPAVVRHPGDIINILFSSGTTGDPKAIPWTMTTPLKCAADGRYHQDIREGHVVCWPTNLGWMMGPWLIFATLMNRGTIALFEGIPTGRGFAKFVQDAQVNMLGLVPSIVKAWRASGCTEGFDWSNIHVFSSTGECSNADDMAWLMGRAGNRPVIEYCGGTEIGGGYITGTVVQEARPATFTTPALGLDLRIIDDEVFLVPPSIGLSNTLLNRDHHEVYYEGVPEDPQGQTLRRHGDQIEHLPDGTFRAHGRVDDTMNLGGIKVSSTAIERLLNQVSGVLETAAVARNPEGGGPSQLVVHVVPEIGAALDPAELQREFQQEIREHLNPLFKVHAVEIIEALPRTASNKVMRRLLR